MCSILHLFIVYFIYCSSRIFSTLIPLNLFSFDRLKIGWSTGRPDVPLSPKEQEAIKNVIRRNELLEMAERQRVGKLVERVENIKSRAAETGPKNCRMCGQAFGLLVGPSKLICDDCRKPVCSKCCIDLNSRSPTKR